jgi:nucleotide-binding universal stress UspA family protein
MKNVLLLIHDDDGQEARLQAALDAARALEGHLTCLHVTEFGPVIGDAFGMSGAVMLLDVERETETKNRTYVERRLAAEDVAFDWIEITGNIEASLEESCGLADLIVVNCETPAIFQPQVRNAAERLVVRSERPLLAVPNEQGFRPADPVLIAWDGSLPAAAAVRAAIPLLALSESVTIYEIDDGPIDASAETTAAYLSRHDIRAEIVHEKAPDRDFVEPLLLSRLESGRFGWAVMGAFSKSRFREALFGGVTKRMLKDSPVPLLIAR